MRKLLTNFIVILLSLFASAAIADEFFICVPNGMQMKLPLVVRPNVANAKQIDFVYKRNVADTYQVTELDDIFIRAKEEKSDPPETAYTLEINRITGEMEVTTRISYEAVRFLANICEGQVPQTQCAQGMEKIKGGSWAACFNAMDRCSNWREGNNFSSRAKMQCSKVERQF